MIVPAPVDDPNDDARWRDAAAVTAALWSFVFLIYLPAIIALHRGQGVGSVALDCSTFLVSMALALLLFALFRVTAGWMAVARLVLVTIGVMAVAVAQAGFDLLFTGFVAHHVERAWATMAIDLARGYGAALRYAGVFAVNAALFQLVISRRRALRQERRLAELVATRQQAELDSMRLKLNPHFLFNTLNSISSLVVTRRNEEAEAALDRLSAFLRASTAGDPQRLAAVEDELTLVQHYAGIEEMRFGDRLQVEIDCAPETAVLPMPALTIQPLVELAVREGVETSGRPVRVAIAATTAEGRLRVTVADDAARPDRQPLETLAAEMRRRLWALYGLRAKLDIQNGVAGSVAIIDLPV